MEQLDPNNLEVFLGLLVKAAQNGQWPFVAVLVLIALVAFVRAKLGPKYPQLTTGAGGALLNLAGAVLGGIGLKLIGGLPFTWALVGTVVLSGGSAALFSLGKALLPLIPGLGALFSRGNAAESITKASKLAAAVDAKAPKVEDIANGP